MARTFSEGLSYAADRVAKTREQRRLNESDQIDQMSKIADMKSKGINITEQQTPRKLFGFIPAGTQRSLSMDYQEPVVPEGFTVVQGKVVRDPSQMSAYEKARVGQGDGLTQTQRNQRDKKREDIYQTVESNKVNRNTLKNALDGAENVPSGWTGKARLGIAKGIPMVKGLMGVNDKMIEDAQELKMALTDATLANTAHTKGAISDAEMYLFKQASANDDFNSPAIQPVLKKMKDFMEANEAAKIGAFKKNYNEDPREWDDLFGDDGGGSGTVRMISPEGIEMLIPKANVEQAKKEGFTNG